MESEREVRTIATFDRIKFKGVGELHLSQGDHEELAIEANEEIRKNISTEVVDGTLVIGYHFDWQDVLGLRWIGAGRTYIFITVKELKGFSLSGAGSLDSKALKTDNLDLSLSGAGSINIESLSASRLTISLSGAGSIATAGKVDSLDAQLSGAGSLKASELQTEEARVVVSGAGSARVKVAKKLDATISGVGSIDFSGEPAVTQKVSGVGSLHKVG